MRDSHEDSLFYHTFILDLVIKKKDVIPRVSHHSFRIGEDIGCSSAILHKSGFAGLAGLRLTIADLGNHVT